MTTSTKPEVNNLSQRRRRKTEPRPQATGAENLVKFSLDGLWDMWVDRKTNRQPDKQTYLSQYLEHLPGRSNNDINSCSPALASSQCTRRSRIVSSTSDGRRSTVYNTYDRRCAVVRVSTEFGTKFYREVSSFCRYPNFLIAQCRIMTLLV